MGEERHLVVDSDNSTCIHLFLPMFGQLHITADLYGVFNTTFETLVVSSHCKNGGITVAMKVSRIPPGECQTFVACTRKELSSANEEECVFICECDTACDNIFIQVQHYAFPNVKLCEITPILYENNTF